MSWWANDPVVEDKPNFAAGDWWQSDPVIDEEASDTFPQVASETGGPSSTPAALQQVEERNFRRWYEDAAKRGGLNPDPDNPLHHYDYRAAYRSGVRVPDATGHWPSEFKRPDHPNRYVDGVDTISGKTAPAEFQQFEEQQAIERAGDTKPLPDWIKQAVPQALRFPAKVAVAGGAMQRGRLYWPTDEDVQTPLVSSEQMKTVMPYAYLADRAAEMFPQSTTAQIAKGVTGGMTDAASSFTSPENLAQLPLAGGGKLAQRLVSGVFLGQAIAGTPEQWEQFNRAENLSDKMRIATAMGIGYALPLWAGAESFRKPKAKPQTAKTTLDADVAEHPALEQQIQNAQRNITQAVADKRFSDAVKWQQVLDDLRAGQVSPDASEVPARVQSEGPKVVEIPRTTQEAASADAVPQTETTLEQKTSPLPGGTSTLGAKSTGAEFVPAQWRGEDLGTDPIPAVRYSDGSIYADLSFRTHAQIAAESTLPFEKIQDGGWIVNGEYRVGGPDAANLGDRARARERIMLKRADNTKTNPLDAPVVQVPRANPTSIPSESARPNIASVPVMITKQMEADLRSRGITEEQIYKMTPVEAHEILSKPIEPGIEAAIAEIQRRNAPAPVQESARSEPTVSRDPASSIPVAENLPAPALEPTTTANRKVSQPEITPTSTKNASTAFERLEAKASKIGKSIEAKAVEAKLTQGFEGTVNYDPIRVKEQAEAATSFIKSSLPNARAVIRGDAPLPEGLRGTSLITAMEEHISRQPSAELAYELANSPLVRATSEAAQEMRLMAERVPDGITAAFEEIKEARRAGSKQRGETVERVAQEIKSEIVRNSSKRPTWEAFVKSLECV